MTEYETRLKNVSDAEEVIDLLEHFGWTDVLKPKIEKAVTIYLHQLPSLVLNSKREQDMGVTQEEIAGRIEGYLYVMFSQFQSERLLFLLAPLLVVLSQTHIWFVV